MTETIRPADTEAERPAQPGSKMRRGAGRRLRDALMARLKARLAPDPPSLKLVFWDGESFAFVPDPAVTITITAANVLRPLLTGDFSRLGDAYVRGEIIVDGRAEAIVAVGVELAERIGRTGWARRLGALAKVLPKWRGKTRDAENVRYHYDVSNEFYALWLDRNMVYSCAYFRTGSEDIDTAQAQKLDHICRKLMLKSGERLLDIGCGWGGLLMWAARHYGVTGTGITLSPAQRDFALARIAAEGLADRIDIRLQDYRDVPEMEAYDKLVSVGMIEHVGLANLPTYFATLDRLVKPGGVVLNHGITVTDPEGRPQGPAGGDFIDRYVFPGGELAHISRIVQGMAATGLEIGAVEDLRPHYAQTLIRWVRRLEAAKDAAIAAAGAERYRIWRVYLAGMALAFDRGWLTVDQVLAYKPAAGKPAARPFTLAHIYDGNAPALAEGLDWRIDAGASGDG